MSKLKYKILIKHRKDCTALKHVVDGSWTTPWSDYPLNVYFASKDGYKKKGSSVIIYEYRCNSTPCPAIAKVWAESITIQMK